MEIFEKVENISRMVKGIDDNREFLTKLMNKIHEDMGRALLEGISNEPEDARDKSLFLLLVQNYVAGFLTADCDPPEDFTNAVRWFYAKGIQHGHAYLITRKELSQ